MNALISAQELTHSFGGKPLFEGLSFAVAEGERLALIGANGSGKSTLMKILAGLIEPDDGEIARRRDLHTGIVQQMEELASSASVLEYLSESLSERIESVGPKFQKSLGGYLGMPLDTELSKLSGGQKKRISILREFLKNPDLLLLDEPTNHLDIDGILWLEDLVVERVSSCVFVSHDRYFIERVATRVVELDRRYPLGHLSVKGAYSDFLEARESFFQVLESRQASLRNKVRRETEWLRQGVKARTTKAKYRIDEAHRLISELNSIVVEERRAEFDFAKSGRKTHELVKAEHLSKSFGERRIVKDLTVTLSPGVRLGIVGPNGAGKTTALKLLSGDLKPDLGKIKNAFGVTTAVFGQAREGLDLSVTLREALCGVGNSVVFNGRELHVVSWAKRFLFRAEQLSLPVGSLSGGEQARALLAKMMLEPADVLFFDEPTNDLDIQTLEVLEESFCEFAGAIVLVSHDRYLVDRVATSILGLSGDGVVTTFADYTQWEIFRRQNIHQLRTEERTEPRLESASSNPTRLTHAERKELGSVERKLAKVDQDIQKIKRELDDPTISSDAELLSKRWAELSAKESEQERLLSRWDELETRKALEE